MATTQNSSFEFTFRKSLPDFRGFRSLTSAASNGSSPVFSPSSWILFNKVVYVASGVFQVLATQFLHYEGAAGSSTMLTVTAAYVGMALVWFSSGGSRKDHFVDQKKIFVIAMVDVLGFSTLTVALFFIGSGIYQVVYSSVVVFTALLSKLFMQKSLGMSQWLSLLIIFAGLSISAMGSDISTTEAGTSFFFGIFLALGGTFLYACVYVLTEKSLSGPPAIQPEVLCYHVGFYGSLLSFMYLLCYTFPSWSILVTQSIEAHAGNNSLVFFLYLCLVAASYFHNKAYFHLIMSIGAVSTGVFQAVRAVIVFVASAFLYCDLEKSQCFTSYKALSTAIVSVGVILYSSVSSKNPGQHVSSTELPTFVGQKGAHPEGKNTIFNA